MNYRDALNTLDGTFIGNLELKIVLSKALEIQIPKKITHEASLYRCCTCPNCLNVIDEFTEFMGDRCRITFEHCKFCGQKLDWSVEEQEGIYPKDNKVDDTIKENEIGRS